MAVLTEPVLKLFNPLAQRGDLLSLSDKLLEEVDDLLLQAPDLFLMRDGSRL